MKKNKSRNNIKRKNKTKEELLDMWKERERKGKT